MKRQFSPQRKSASTKKPKYNAKKTEVDGITFDSSKEARRWMELRIREKNGEITELRRQVSYELIPAQREPDSFGPKGGRKPGRMIERAVFYVADFAYRENGRLVVEDVKGMKHGTAYSVFTIKRKLMLWRYGIRVREV